MVDRYGIWLSWNNQEDGFELPILPRQLGPSIRGDGAEHDVHGLGKINVIKDRGLAEYTIESIFPGQWYPYISAPQSLVLKPRVYVEKIMKWWDTKWPIRFVAVIPSLEINIPVSIESFEWQEVAGSPGDIQFTLKLKEYRFYSALRVRILDEQGGTRITDGSASARPDDRVRPKTYTLAPGDNLWKVAQKMLGDGNRWREIQKLNGISDAQLRRLPAGMVLKLPT
jgi:hypothetical protein